LRRSRARKLESDDKCGTGGFARGWRSFWYENERWGMGIREVVAFFFVIFNFFLIFCVFFFLKKDGHGKNKLIGTDNRNIKVG
jgi:hypothetical protein